MFVQSRLTTKLNAPKNCVGFQWALTYCPMLVVDVFKSFRRSLAIGGLNCPEPCSSVSEVVVTCRAEGSRLRCNFQVNCQYSCPLCITSVLSSSSTCSFDNQFGKNRVNVSAWILGIAATWKHVILAWRVFKTLAKKHRQIEIDHFFIHIY
jgi:hypothetical protein